MAVLVSMAGVFLISYVGTTEETSNLFPKELEGNLYMLGSAFTWGLYEVFYKKFIGDAQLNVSRNSLTRVKMSFFADFLV
jgi:drug/metabolite transporter (DMT)-like permease